MASRNPVPALRSLTRRSRQTCKCSATRRSEARQFSSKARLAQEPETIPEERPRWSQTPPMMQAPFQPRIKDPTKTWEVNEDPAKIDAMYVRLLGKGGDKVLSDEVKWLALTHKSYDQGRRGFNDRLANLGKRLLVLQANIALLHAAPGLPLTDPLNRTEFSHPSLTGLSNLTSTHLGEVFAKERVAQLAKTYGIDQVARWKPRNPNNLDVSGCDVVYTACVYAIVGAVALERGGAKANEVARELVLKPLGL